jgi:diguanylate cyclase (GGDEF)-like protein
VPVLRGSREGARSSPLYCGESYRWAGALPVSRTFVPPDRGGSSGWLRVTTRVGMRRSQEPTVELSQTAGARRRGLATVAVLLVATLMAGTTVFVVAHLQRGADRARDQQVTLDHLDTTFSVLQAPYTFDPKAGGSPKKGLAQLTATEQGIQRTLGTLMRDGAPVQLRAVESPLAANFASLARIREIGARGQLASLAPEVAVADRTFAGVRRAFGAAGVEYEARAATATRQAMLGAAAMLVVLLVAFAIFYVRSRRLGRANEMLLDASRGEALSDALTGLANRRALMADLEAAFVDQTVTPGRRAMLALFDLDGFKEYNDTFGHPAGDELLARLGERLRITVGGLGTAYRMGGDEFCVLANLTEDDGKAISGLAAAALSDDGQGFHIGCSYGHTVLPAEASTPEQALSIADQRMYAQKTSGRKSAGRQSTDVLLRVLTERSIGLEEHTSEVARLTQKTARRLGQSTEDVRRIALAAELHDIGKTAIPDAILNKPGPLNDDEWAFMRRHTLIGERIISAAPSLAPAGEIVRSSHERYDGGGYPDALSGDEIPLGSRIIAVCDAFSAMVSDRTYRPAMPVAQAIAELRRCSGTQFHAEIVDAFCAMLKQPDQANNATAAPASSPIVRALPQPTSGALTSA